MYELIKTKTEDSVVLNGLYIPGDKAKAIVIHIHGLEGDFFNNAFVNVIGKTLFKNGFGFLSIQTRGMGNEYNLDVDLGDGEDKVRKYGAHFELLSEAYRDIDAAVKFLVDAGYSKIVLQGHSLGTFKVMRYMSEGKHKADISKLILLSPFDKNYLAEVYTGGKWPEYVKQAIKMIKEGRGWEIIPKEWDDLVISYQTYASWYEDSEFGRMFNFSDNNYDFPVLSSLKIPVKVIVGSEDEYFYTSNKNNYQEALDIMTAHIKSFSSRLIESAHHTFGGYEEVVAEEVVKFLN